MEGTARDADEGWEFPAGSRGPEQQAEYYPVDSVGAVDMEPGRSAADALMQLKCETLLHVMLRPSFLPIQDAAMVPIYPCPYCGDGGLRTAGTVRLRKGQAFVRACDTCCAVEVGERKIH